MILGLAFANLSRRRLRSIVTASGVAIAIAVLYCMASFQQGYQNGLKRELDRLGAHLLVVPKGCPYDAASIALHGASWPCYLKSAYLKTVRNTQNVSVAAPVFMSAVYDASTGAQTVYCGIEPDMLDVKRFWRINGAFPKREGELLVGSEMAASRKLSVGQEIALPGMDGPKGKVAGILGATQAADDMFIYMPLADAQRIFKRPNEITHILVRLDKPELMENVVGELRGCDAGLDMNVVPLAHLFHTIENLVQSTRLLLFSVALVALIAAGAGVSNTILMAVSERTREIGVLRAIGAGRSAVFGLIWCETTVLCAIGGLTGVAIALIGSKAVEAWLRARLPFAPNSILVSIEWRLLAACLAGALLLGTVAALIPAWRATRLSPTEAIRAGAAA